MINKRLLLLPFFSCLSATLPLAAQQVQTIDSLTCKAAQCFAQNDTEQARSLYEKILQLEPEHLQANIFLGNYYYLQAEQHRTALEMEYRRITQPTRMQQADFRNRMSSLLKEEYAHAKRCLQCACRHLPSTEVNRTLEAITTLEQEYL